MRHEHSKSHEKDKLRRIIIRPQDLPEPHHFLKGELALERDEHPSEAEEEVQRVGLFEVPVQLGIHHGEELLQGRELFLHPALISQEVDFLTRRVSMRGRRGYQTDVPCDP